MPVLQGTFCYTQPHIWYYCIIDKIQSEYLVQVFSLHYNQKQPPEVFAKLTPVPESLF